MGRRLELQTLLETLLGTDPADKINVYFQPPANVQMKYPCIRYERYDMATRFAGNVPYHLTKRYQVTVISDDPDCEIPMKLAALPMCTFSRFFIAENLNHDIYTLYF